jgi:uncharacterized protein (TIGR00369 family)
MNAEKRFEPKSANFAERVRKIFAEQSIMQLIGARLARIEPGAIDIEIGYQKSLTQQNGFIHAGIITTIADSACGYAAFSLMPETADVLSVEFKVNLLAPAIGEKFLAQGRVLRAGKTLTVARGDVFAFEGTERKQIAAMQATIIRIQK